MIARPNISRNEWKTAELGAFEVGNFAPLSCPGSDGAGPSLVGAVGFLAALVARHRRDRSRRGVAAPRAVGALLEREAGALAACGELRRCSARRSRRCATTRASQDDDDAAAAARCALGRELRKRLGAAPERFQRGALRRAARAPRSPRGGDDAPAVAGPRLGEHELQVALAECSHLATALGDAAAPCGDGLERAALSFSSDASWRPRQAASAARSAARCARGSRPWRRWR
ncbi:acetylcholine-gated cation-selective channel [Aureococcus anophagefferens]|nr:acetylcholine-gated cation-selective channel [Aureococcus anophagefferens]